MNAERSLAESREISLGDVVQFLKISQKGISLGVIAGILLAVAYLSFTPRKFEVRWQMQMAQLGSGNAEEPAALVQRLRYPTTYSADVIGVCLKPEPADPGEYLGSVLKTEVQKASNNIIDLKIAAESPDQAKACAEAITAMIVTQQKALIEIRLAGRQEQLSQYKRALKEEQLELDQLKRTEASNFGYLVRLDKLSWLRSRIDALEEEALLSQLRPARLIAPIYASNKPVPRHGGLTILLGAVSGFMLGLLGAAIVRIRDHRRTK